MRRALQQCSEVFEYVEHDRTCILTRFECGEPTADGGYQVKYAGRWYANQDDVPCACGLRDVLTRWQAAVQEVEVEKT